MEEVPEIRVRNRLFFPCGPARKTVLAGLMKTLSLPMIVVVSTLSLASANAMPDLGRETGRFIRNNEPVPKGVRTFEPAKAQNSQASLSFLGPWRPPVNPSFLAPWRPQADLSFLAPWRPHGNLSFLAPWRPQADLSFLAPWKPQADLAFLAPWQHGGSRVAL